MTRNRRRLPQVSRQQQTVEYLLERGTLADLKNAKLQMAKFLKYQWCKYSELAHQRNAIKDQLIQAIIQTSISDHKVDKWQRAVKYKYGLHPLSTVGSIQLFGGRFNTGVDVNSEIPFFPALYLASDKDTALQEHLGQQPVKKSLLTPRELAFINPSSETIVSVSGKLEKVFDLTNIKNLIPFVNLIKGFTLSEGLKKQARELGLLGDTKLIKTPQELLKSLLIPDWSIWPAKGEVPANSQVFGHLVYTAGIEGILYPSKLTGKPCLAIFPHNFPNSSSFLSLDDEAPHERVPCRVDGSNWRVSDLSFEEILANHSFANN